ncbi:MAG TPA: hypothetical protein PL066_02765 [bacterium]|nr:hypothetical protein [bacterium]
MIDDKTTPQRPPKFVSGDIGEGNIDELFTSGVIDMPEGETEEKLAKPQESSALARPEFADKAAKIKNPLLRHFWFGKKGQYDRLLERAQAVKKNKEAQEDLVYFENLLERTPLPLLDLVNFTNNWEYRQLGSLAQRLERQFSKQFDAATISQLILAIRDKFDQESEIFDQDGWESEVNVFTRRWLGTEENRKHGFLIKVFDRISVFWRKAEKTKDLEALKKEAEVLRGFLSKILQDVEGQKNVTGPAVENVPVKKPAPASKPAEQDSDEDEFVFDDDEPILPEEEEEIEEGGEEEETAVPTSPANPLVGAPVKETLPERKTSEFAFNKDNFEFLSTALQDDVIAQSFKEQLALAQKSALFYLIVNYKTGDALPDLNQHWDDLSNILASIISESLEALYKKYEHEEWLSVLEPYWKPAGQVDASVAGNVQETKRFPVSAKPTIIRGYWDLYRALLRLEASQK